MKPSFTASQTNSREVAALTTTGCDCRAKQILILMSDTGGGHRAAAEAIREGLLFLYGDRVSVTIVDAWKDYAIWPVNRIADMYGWTVNRALWIWKSLWRLEKKRYFIKSLFSAIYPLAAPSFLKLIEEHQPNIIVSVHPVLTHVSLLVIERANLRIPFVTVVTDMIKSWDVWYRPSTTLCLVPTTSIGRQAMRLGIPATKVNVVGQPVSLKMRTETGAKGPVRRLLGLDPALPVALLAGGGEGYGRVYDIARGIDRRVSGIQLIVVAGRNSSLRKKLEAQRWKLPTFIYGFTTQMANLMQAADVFITKAGPGSISEAFVVGLPLILFAYIPGQEDANVEYVLQHKAGVYVPEPEQIANQLSKWLRPESAVLDKLAQNALSLAQPEAALSVAQRVYELVP